MLLCTTANINVNFFFLLDGGLFEEQIWPVNHYIFQDYKECLECHLVYICDWVHNSILLVRTTNPISGRSNFQRIHFWAQLIHWSILKLWLKPVFYTDLCQPVLLGLIKIRICSVFLHIWICIDILMWVHMQVWF